MNPELKQRLIGAVVVTALAAIFVPMLFDDPVDNSGQKVSELVIPATPVNTGEESANKLPTSANQVLNAPVAGSETVVNTEEEAELAANKQLPSDVPLDDEPPINAEEGSEQLADEPDQPIDESANAGSSRQKPASQLPLETDAAVATPDKPVKKAEINKPKAASIEKPLAAAAVNKTEKPGSGLSRWYIQAGTFSKKENAVSLMATLRKQGLPVTLEATRGGLYRLKVGPALEKKRAAEMKAKLDSQKIPSILIAE